MHSKRKAVVPDHLWAERVAKISQISGQQFDELLTQNVEKDYKFFFFGLNILLFYVPP